MSDRPILRTILLSLAIILAGLAIGGGVMRFRLADRSVTVKGVAERDVQADIALWPMRIVASGTELAPTQDKLAEDQRIVRRFLASHGIDSANVRLQSLEVIDKRSNPYEGNPSSARYAINATLVARTEHPERIRAASQDVGQLVAAGVALSSGGGWGTGAHVPVHAVERLEALDAGRSHRQRTRGGCRVREALGRARGQHPARAAGAVRDPAARPGPGYSRGQSAREAAARGHHARVRALVSLESRRG